MDSIARILLIWLLCLLSVFLHEYGHALGCRLSAGKMGRKIFVGSGPKILSIAKCTFFLIPAGGYFAPGGELRTKKAKVTMLAGGPLFSLLLTALFFCLCRFSFFGMIHPGNELYDVLYSVSSFLFYFNLFQFFFTAVPMRYRIVCRGLESDGLQIIQTLKHEKD